MQFATAYFRFYEELNDFLPPAKRKIEFEQTITPAASIKDVIESLGVPHTEVDLILVNGKSVDFSYQIKANDRVSVYPVFESLDISPVTHLRPKPLRVTRFVLDVHLGKLARHLRLLGFDTLYTNHYSDEEIMHIAVQEKRIILTRDIGILKNKKVTHGYWLRETNPKKQVMEIVKRFDLKRQINPFTRCLVCNGYIIAVDVDNMPEEQIPPLVKEIQSRLLSTTKLTSSLSSAKFRDKFFQCEQCKKIYWEGTHYKKLEALVEFVKRECS